MRRATRVDAVQHGCQWSGRTRCSTGDPDQQNTGMAAIVAPVDEKTSRLLGFFFA